MILRLILEKLYWSVLYSRKHNLKNYVFVLINLLLKRSNICLITFQCFFFISSLCWSARAKYFPSGDHLEVEKTTNKLLQSHTNESRPNINTNHTWTWTLDLATVPLNYTHTNKFTTTRQKPTCRHRHNAPQPPAITITVANGNARRWRRSLKTAITPELCRAWKNTQEGWYCGFKIYKLNYVWMLKNANKCRVRTVNTIWKSSILLNVRILSNKLSLNRSKLYSKKNANVKRIVGGFLSTN